jgi:hypothetical protein
MSASKADRVVVWAWLEDKRRTHVKNKTLPFIAVICVWIGFGCAVRGVQAAQRSRASALRRRQLRNLKSFEVNNFVAGISFFLRSGTMARWIGLSKARGITVDGLFLPPGESEWVQQPAFYFEGYDRNGNWMLSNGQNGWKVRFSPHKTGAWQFKLRAQDAGGVAESASYSFTVTDTNHRGFVRVSSRDPRYFEYTNGDPFHVIGFNEPHWEPLYTGVQPNDIEPRMKKYGDNGINLLRVWISEMYGAGWLAWYTGRGLWQQYIPRSGVTPFSDRASPSARDIDNAGQISRGLV